LGVYNDSMISYRDMISQGRFPADECNYPNPAG
jgi:hypothetical protein